MKSQLRKASIMLAFIALAVFAVGNVFANGEAEGGQAAAATGPVKQIGRAHV